VFDPIPGITVRYVSDILDPGNMDMPTDDSVTFQLFCVTDKTFFEIADELNRLLGPHFHVLAEPPVFQFETPTHSINHAIRRNQPVISKRPDDRQPFRTTFDIVELIAMQQEALSA
jgi:hypothetical protein